MNFDHLNTYNGRSPISYPPIHLASKNLFISALNTPQNVHLELHQEFQRFITLHLSPKWFSA